MPTGAAAVATARPTGGSRPSKRVWTTPPIANTLVPYGGAITLDLRGLRWQGKFVKFHCSKSFTLT
eukprot:12854005-Heterocapsa_arctica.AAC.1